jgi:hypothetical protein
MGISGGPNIIEDGLVLALDAADVFLPVNKNLLTYTNDLSNAAWGKIRSQITASATTAPDGTNTAFAMTITDATGLVRLSQSPISASIVGGPYTFSVYLKQNNISASLFDTGIYNTSTTSGSEPSYNILNNFAATGSSGGYVSNRTVTSVGNGWYRVATTATIANNSSWYLFFDIEAGSGTKTNGQSLYLWGPQFEYGTIATEYQPVNVTTRIWPNLVNQSVSGSLLNNPAFDPSNGGSIVFDGVNDNVTVPIPTQLGNIDYSIDFTLLVATSSANYGIFLWGSGVFNTNGLGIETRFQTNQLEYSINDGTGTGTRLQYSFSNVTDNQYRHYTLTQIKQGTATLYVNGTSVVTQNYASESLFTNTSSLLVGRGTDGYLNGKIANFRVYNRALSASEVAQNYNSTKTRFGL